MADNELNRPMTRVYDTRVLEKAPLWKWTGASLYLMAPGLYLMAPGLHGVFLSTNWIDEISGRHMRDLSFAERTVYSSRSLDDAALARDEWNAMIKAARLLAGAVRAPV